MQLLFLWNRHHQRSGVGVEQETSFRSVFRVPGTPPAYLGSVWTWSFRYEYLLWALTDVSSEAGVEADIIGGFVMIQGPTGRPSLRQNCLWLRNNRSLGLSDEGNNREDLCGSRRQGVERVPPGSQWCHSHHSIPSTQLLKGEWAEAAIFWKTRT